MNQSRIPMPEPQPEPARWRCEACHRPLRRQPAMVNGKPMGKVCASKAAPPTIKLVKDGRPVQPGEDWRTGEMFGSGA